MSDPYLDRRPKGHIHSWEEVKFNSLGLAVAWECDCGAVFRYADGEWRYVS